jgi:hypothetical protein
MAQKEHFFKTRIGFENQAQRDRGMSPLKYSGFGIYAGIEYQRTVKRKTDYIELNHSRSSLANINGNNINEISSSIKTYTFYHPEGEGASIVQWGWSNMNVLNIREIPFFGNFRERADYYTSFGPAIRAFYPFSLFNINFCAQAIAHAQLLGFFMRPSLVINTPIGFINHSDSFFPAFFESTELFYPGKAWNFGFRPQIIINMESGNRLSMAYDFDFYRLNSIDPVSHVSGVLKITLTTRLSKTRNK